MHLDIEDSSLESLLQNYKDYIGESWVNGIVNIIGGCSFIVTIYSAKLAISGVEILLYIIAILLITIGTVQVWRGTGKRKLFQIVYGHKKTKYHGKSVFFGGNCK